MAYEEEDVYSDEGTISPLQMLMMPGFSTVTPEGKAKAAQVFDDLYGQRSAYDEDEQKAYDEYETQARAARETLRKARQVLAAKRTPTTKWLEMARGFGAPTRAGSFAESISNYAGERIPGKQREAEWEDNRDRQLLEFDQGIGGIDQQLALQRLKLRQARRAADDKLMIESMKIMGKPTPGAGKKTPRQEVQGAVDKAYAKDYLAFIQGGAADAAKNIGELKRAKEILQTTDMVSGPAIGIVPKVLRDIFVPKSSATQEDVESTVQSTLKEILGSQFTQAEGERLLARVYNPRFEEKVNARRVQKLLDRMERAYNEKVKAAQYFEERGTLEGYKGKTTWALDDFDVDLPEDDDPAAIAGGMQEAIMGGGPSRRPAPATAAPAPDEDMEEIDIEMLLPAGDGYAEGGKVQTVKNLFTALSADSNALLKSLKVWADRDGYPSDPQALRAYSAKLMKMADLDQSAPEDILAQALQEKLPFDRFDEWRSGDKQFDRRYRLGKDTDPEGFAEGGPVQGQFPDGRPRFRMPDGKVIRARPGDDYDTVLQLYTRATGTAPTRPGLPPQQIPLREDVEQTQEPMGPPPPQAPPPQAAAPGEQPPSFGEVALDELPSALAYTAAGAAGAGLGDKVLTSVGDRLIPGRRETPAQRRVLDMLQEQRRSPADVVTGVRQQQKMGIPAMAMDDPALRPTADNVLPETGLQNASTILQRLNERAEGSGERAMDRVNQGLKPDPYFDQLDKLRENLYTNSKPLYQQAYAANPTVVSKVLPRLLDTPDGKKAVKSALRILRNEGKKIGKQDAMGMVTKPSLEFLDKVKQGLDDLIVKEEGHGPNYKATALGKSMRALRDALRDELDTATAPAKGESLYKKAREQYAGDLEVLDALQSGRDDFSRMQPEEVAKRVKAMSFAEKDAYRTGAAQGLFEQIESPTGDFNAARKVIGSPAMRKKLRVLFDNDKQYQLFETALKRESELYDLDKKSVRRAEAGQEAHAEPREGVIKRGSKYVPRLGIKSPTMWALQFIRNNQQVTEKKMDEVLHHLKASTPEELADLEQTLGPKYDRRFKRKGRAAKTAVAGALAGAAYKVATGAEPEEGDDDAQ